MGTDPPSLRRKLGGYEHYASLGHTERAKKRRYGGGVHPTQLR